MTIWMGWEQGMVSGYKWDDKGAWLVVINRMKKEHG